MIFSVGGGVLTVFVITRSFGLCIVPIALLYFWFMTRFLSAAREIQRYQSISKSPLLSHVSECIEGLYVIRSLGTQSITHIHKSHETSLNVYLRVSMTVALGSAWFSLRIQLLGSLFILVISLILFIGSSSSNSSSDGSSGSSSSSGSGSAFTISSNMIALALSYTLSVSDDFMDFVLICSWCEQAMISPERILQYIHLIAEGTEANLKLFRAEKDHDEAYEGGHPPLPPPAGTGIAVGTEDENELEENEDDVTVALLGSHTPTPHRNTATPPTPTRSFSQNSWPSHGIIEFHNVYFKYQPMSQEMILSNLSFHTTAHEKIGIVGRTGAGKSSLTMSLFRIAELSSGMIVIDGEDISHLSLHTLRNAITIIPQAPVLFRGSLKSYLDPFQEYSEEHIWRILRKTHVADLIQQMMDPTPSPSSCLGPSLGPSADPSPAAVAVSEPYSISDYLQFELAENGENFSIGQRQLLVLSRALLKEVKILIMDEATASMDRETDQRIQQILREEFRGATVLTIAHRIETIIDCDRILVLSAGTAHPFPHSLTPPHSSSP
jgi:ABC-type multidrug transport system fused ATPase/permease subunit